MKNWKVRFGYKCKVNINIEDLSKPGTAIVWRYSLETKEVTILVTCRAQIAFLKDYALLNLYAPSGSDKKFDRAIFFSQDVCRAFNLHPDSNWILVFFGFQFSGAFL